MNDPNLLQYAVVNNETDKIEGLSNRFVSQFFKADEIHEQYLVSPYLKNLNIGDPFPFETNKYLLNEGNSLISKSNEVIDNANKIVIEIPRKMVNKLNNNDSDQDDQTVEKICRTYLEKSEIYLKGNLRYGKEEKTGKGSTTPLTTFVNKQEGFTETEYIATTGRKLPFNTTNGIVCIYQNKAHFIPRDKIVNMVSSKNVLITGALIETDMLVRIKYNEFTPSLSAKKTIPENDTEEDEPKKKKGMRM